MDVNSRWIGEPDQDERGDKWDQNALGTRKEIELAQHYPITFDFAQSWLTPSLKEGIPAMKKRILETLIFLRDSPSLSGINNF